jgi:hypothetical protein
MPGRGEGSECRTHLRTRRKRTQWTHRRHLVGGWIAP